MPNLCEGCTFSVYDDIMGDYVCEAYIDEDEAYRIAQSGKTCPYYRTSDDYKLAKRQ